ncbi:cytochrome B561 [Candidatus Francisella endociliophora]|uniref:Cytochrome B561 n=1 Tax=Candidatus Francisella endociliophora TaxID=653937 RepID=A0A097ERW5_9GAMM|nr:cytochrome B561 [Francisella sp. FSC1006]
MTIIRLVLRKFIVFPIIGQRLFYNSFRSFLARSVHVFLYLWLILMSVLGWAIISAKGTYIIPFGLPTMLDVMPRANVIGIKELHETFAYVGLGVIFGHAVVAIIENYLLRSKS